MQRTNSAAATGNQAGRRQRPMTAKVKNSGLRWITKSMKITK